jgi:hypothetical protein
MSEQERINDYDDSPWLYCASCLSPKIKHEEIIDSDCCGDCGCTNILETSFEEWEKKYEKKYGRKYAEKSNDIRKSPVFKMTFSELMKKVSNSSKWESIIQGIYGCLPKGCSKSDSIVIFFDKLIKDNKLDSLRILLYKMEI